MAKTNTGTIEAKLGFWQTIIVALITSVTTWLVTKKTDDPKLDIKTENILPQIQKYESIDSLKPTPQEKYKLIKDISIFDLREWKYVPDSLLNKPISPVKFTNYLHVKKIKEIDKISYHFGSTATIPKIKCLTHQSNVNLITNIHHKDNPKMKTYGITVDISEEPLNKEFLIVVESIYYNSFNNPKEEDCETYTDNEITYLNELALMVILPETKSFINDPLRLKISSDGKESDFNGVQNWYRDKDKKFAYWNIRSFKANHHYKLKWQW